MIPEESDEDLPVTMQGDDDEVDTYRTPQGTLKMSSSTQPSMTLSRTR